MTKKREIDTKIFQRIFNQAYTRGKEQISYPPIHRSKNERSGKRLIIVTHTQKVNDLIIRAIRTRVTSWSPNSDREETILNLEIYNSKKIRLVFKAKKMDCGSMHYFSACDEHPLGSKIIYNKDWVLEKGKLPEI